jgi:diguanylate cyclase (GGDEF)-like protein
MEKGKIMKARAKILVENTLIALPKNMKEELNKQNFDVYYFKNGFELINLLKSHNIDLLVIHNLKLLRELRKYYSKTSLPALVLTYTVQEAVNDVYEYANDFVNANVIYDDLIPKIYITLKRCKKVKDLIDLTNKDYMTGVYNKRYFYQEATKIYNNFNDIAICMVDLNNFKMINDTYGHLVGDFAIKELAELLEKNIKGKDLIARFGGDEFCILLRDISEDDTKNYIESLKSIVKKHNFKIMEKDLHLTISVGYTTDKDSSLVQMINKADLNLLSSKKSKPKVKVCTNCNLCKKLGSSKKDKKAEKNEVEKVTEKA